MHRLKIHNTTKYNLHTTNINDVIAAEVVTYFEHAHEFVTTDAVGMIKIEQVERPLKFLLQTAFQLHA